MLNEQLGMLGYVIFLIIYYKIYNIITFKRAKILMYIAFILFLQETGNFSMFKLFLINLRCNYLMEGRIN